jgi:tetratricopeptide (TPR) repeat protein
MNVTNRTYYRNWKEQKEAFLNHYYYKKAEDVCDTDEEKALSFLYAELEQCKENGYAHYEMARLYLCQEQYGLAMSSILNAIRYLQSDNEWLSSAYQLKARILRELGDWKQELKCLNKAILCYPDADAYESRAEYYFTIDEYDKSDEDYWKVTELDPAGTRGFFGLGRNDYFQENYGSALSWFRFCLKLDPNHPDAYLWMARCLKKQNDLAGCIKACINSIQLERDPLNAAVCLMDICYFEHDFVLESALTVEAQKEPDSALWPYLLGCYYEFKSRYYDAIRSFKEAYGLKPEPAILSMIADCYINTGNYRQAEVYLRQMTDADKDDFDARYGLASVYHKQCRFDEAWREYEWCNKARPEDVNVLMGMSEVCRMQKRFDDAVRYAKIAAGLDINNTECWMTWSHAYEMQGNTERQKDCLKTILKLFDAYPDEDGIHAVDCSDGNIAIALYLTVGTEGEDPKTFYKHYFESDSWHNWSYLKDAWMLTNLNLLDEAREALENALKEGYRDFDLLLQLDIWQCLHRIPGFEDLIGHYRQLAQEEWEKESPDA